MKTLLLTTVAATLAIAAPALAQDYYGGVSYSSTSVDDVDADIGSVTGRFGAKFNPYFGVEGEASFGVKDETVSVAGVNVDVEPQYDAAVYGVVSAPISPNLEVFARGGYGTTEVDVSAAGLSETANGESWNYGVGANYFFDGVNGVRADWTRKDFEDDGGEADVWSLGYVRRF